jgi:predicted ribosomally synthesized peptide with SipW-like signal peptide
MSKKILLSIITIAVAVGLVAVGTGAWFSSTVPSVGNTFTTGTLSLTVGSLSVLPPQSFVNKAPGWSDSMAFDCVNGGSLPGYLYLDVTKSGALAAYIDVVVKDGSTTFYTGKLADMPASINLGALAAGGTHNLKIGYSIADTVGNEAQGLTAVANATFSLEQNARP